MAVVLVLVLVAEAVASAAEPDVVLEAVASAFVFETVNEVVTDPLVALAAEEYELTVLWLGRLTREEELVAPAKSSPPRLELALLLEMALKAEVVEDLVIETVVDMFATTQAEGVTAAVAETEAVKSRCCEY